MKVTTRKGEPWITVPKLEPLAEPTGLAALKEEVARRWGVLPVESSGSRGRTGGSFG
ncbi:hypothetical protein GCM10010246_77370 [Streptomyces cuspidosporus]|uniref:Uncharacterized protein n=1 Tax=Streptomyces cuspidosporus TaxID=66882 RepID=A0ABN3H7G6_9ACTN